VTPGEGSWGVGSAKPAEDQQKNLLVNICTDPAYATRTVDLGPPAENKKEAAAFRQFWGEKAELRRFKDGSILESVVWSQKDSPMSVMEQIIRYIIQRHIGAAAAENARFAFDSFAHLIPAGRIQGQSGVSAFSARMNALTALEKDIRGLEGLPLSIRHINAADPQLRYSSVEVDSLRMPASVVLQFEGSARWPDDPCAIQRTKIAFLLKLSELLSAEQPSYVTRVGLENQSSPSQNQAFLDIILPSGFSFRFRIHHDREAYLLDRQLKDKNLDSQSRESAGAALAIYKRDYLQVPAHTQALQTLCTRYPALSPAIRLTKRWFASHMLSPHFSEELIELLVVRTFLQPYPWSVPSTATTGFLRTILWISRWDWRHVPLIVDYSSHSTTNTAGGESTGSLTSEDLQKIQTRFEAWRRIDPAMNRVVFFAATNLDTDGTTWSDKAHPEKVVAARMTALARITTEAQRSADNAVLSSMNGEPFSDAVAPETLFMSNLQDYDILIHLSPKYTHASSKRKSEARFKNLELQQGALSTEDRQNIGFNPAALLAEDVHAMYGDAVLWFWNPERIDVVAGLWNPLVTGQRRWKVRPGWNSVPVRLAGKGEKAKNKDNGSGTEEDDRNEEEGAGVEIRINKEAICNEIKRVGGELVSRIEMLR
jgi:U3 small nucleolar RNA-associated protein 22